MNKTCEFCRWWYGVKKGINSGYSFCESKDLRENLIINNEDDGDYIKTFIDFGCIHWQAKDEEQTK